MLTEIFDKLGIDSDEMRAALLRMQQVLHDSNLTQPECIMALNILLAVNFYQPGNRVTCERLAAEGIGATFGLIHDMLDQKIMRRQ